MNSTHPEERPPSFDWEVSQLDARPLSESGRMPGGTDGEGSTFEPLKTSTHWWDRQDIWTR
jgi:hypothetical protein